MKIKLMRLVIIVSALLTGACGPNPSRDGAGDVVDVTDFFLNNNSGHFLASQDTVGFANSQDCGTNNLCREEFTVQKNGEFSRVLIRNVGQRDSLNLPVGTFCKWSEQGKIYRVKQLDSKMKNEPSEVTHLVYAVITDHNPDKNNPSACDNYFTINFTPLSRKMYASILSTNSLQFHSYGEGQNLGSNIGSLATTNEFLRQ